MIGKYWITFGSAILIASMYLVVCFTIAFGRNFVPADPTEAICDLICFFGVIISLAMIAHGKTLNQGG